MRVGVVVRPNSDGAKKTAEAFVDICAHKGINAATVVERADDVAFDSTSLDGCEVIVGFGGDGTVLEATRYGLANDAPVLGVNVGRVGFLAEAEPDDLAVLVEMIAARDWAEVSRMTLTATLESGISGVGLNDIVVEKVNSQQLVSLELYIDGDRFLTYRADGLVFATPTGSTAYNLSAGGPIVDPSLDMTIVTPVAPYSLFSRSLCLPPTTSIVCSITHDRAAGVSADGVVLSTMRPGESVRIERSPQRARFITLAKRSHSQTVKSKLKLYEGLDGASF